MFKVLGQNITLSADVSIGTSVTTGFSAGVTIEKKIFGICIFPYFILIIRDWYSLRYELTI
jgi:hypothetical protein